MVLASARLLLRAPAVTFIKSNVRRNFGASTVALKTAATDPIQKLFADKVGEYAQKKTASGGKLVDASKEAEASLQEELDKVAQSFGGGKGIDMTAFPVFNFQEPKLTPLI